MSPFKIIKKIFEKVYYIIKNKIFKYLDLTRDTHLNNKKYSNFSNYSYININDLDNTNIDRESSEYLCDMYLTHSFDLLGSGYVNVTYDMNCHGLEGNIYNGSLHINDFDIGGEWLNKILIKKHLPAAKNIWKQVEIGYNPIDWQMDFKSGFRYSQKKWYQDQPIGKNKGVDIKVPWELSRLQHLPQLAVFAILFPQRRESILKEFRNQILDFIMVNPPRMGVVWKCTMDVAIRVSNMLIAFDMLNQIDMLSKLYILDESFKKIFYLSIYEHGHFIINNLEWYGGATGNHYLSDICGLLFVSAYLKRDEAIDSWMLFSVQEIISQVLVQFHEDGSNFEASTSYHRLSGELMVYATSLIYGVLKTDKRKTLIECRFNKVRRLLPVYKQKFDVFSGEFFPIEYIKRIYRAALFTTDITKQNGEIPQIGDNDSGRFFIFSPNGVLLNKSDAIKRYINLREYKFVLDRYFDENILNHDTFISAANGLFDDEKLSSRDKFNLETSIIKSLCKGKKFKTEELGFNDGLHHKEDLAYKENLDKLQCDLRYFIIKEIKYSDYTNEGIDINSIETKCYQNFGLYIFKCDKFYLSVMAGDIGQNGNGGHSHNDKLSFELNIAGTDIYIDPGTYLYTPNPSLRNKFRSVKVHNAPIIDGQEQCLFTGVFSMKNEIKCEILDFSYHKLILYLTYRDIKIVREFRIGSQSIIIIDRCNKKICQDFKMSKVVSNGYGKLMNYK